MSNDWPRSFTIPAASRAPNNRLLGQRLSEYLFRNGTVAREGQALGWGTHSNPLTDDGGECES